jgi:hypothetical protein
MVGGLLDDDVRILEMEAVERKWGSQSPTTRFFGKAYTECNINPHSPRDRSSDFPFLWTDIGYPYLSSGYQGKIGSSGVSHNSDRGSLNNVTPCGSCVLISLSFLWCSSKHGN